MRTAALIPAVLLLATGAGAAEIAVLDRQRLVSHMEMTASWFLDEVSDLTPAQLDFRRAAGEWSILEVVEHLVVVGPIYWEDLQRSLRSPPADRPAAASDADILWYGIDRTHRETALRSESPGGKLRDLATGLQAYRRHHARLLEYIRSTTADLRRHVVVRQQCDAYQWALLISTHEQRHVLQIREIKSDPGFPKSAGK
jgi:hypothetical protein